MHCGLHLKMTKRLSAMSCSAGELLIRKSLNLLPPPSFASGTMLLKSAAKQPCATVRVTNVRNAAKMARPVILRPVRCWGGMLKILQSPSAFFQKMINASRIQRHVSIVVRRTTECVFLKRTSRLAIRSKMTRVTIFMMVKVTVSVSSMSVKRHAGRTTVSTNGQNHHLAKRREYLDFRELLPV